MLTTAGVTLRVTSMTAARAGRAHLSDFGMAWRVNDQERAAGRRGPDRAM
jgi:hypothetical protein